MVAKITEHLFTIEINYFGEKMFFMVISNYINHEKGLVNDLDTTYIRIHSWKAREDITDILVHALLHLK